MDKPGYKTTEWWLTLAAVVVGMLIASGIVTEASSFHKALVFCASTLAAMGYQFSRAAVKKAPPPEEEE